MPAAGLTLDVVGATGQVQRVPERYSGDEPGVLDVDANLAEGAAASWPVVPLALRARGADGQHPGSQRYRQTRTRTARARALQDAAPGAGVGLSADAAERGVSQGDGPGSGTASRSRCPCRPSAALPTCRTSCARS